MVFIESAVDLMRVFIALPVFGYAAYRDILERRVRHYVWYPLVFVGLIGLVVDLLVRDLNYVLISGVFSLGIGLLFGYGFYYLGTFGGADRYALVVLALAFPVYPKINLPLIGFIPVIVPNAEIFILTVLGNTVIVGLFYPFRLLIENILRRNTGNPLLMFLGKSVEVESLHNHYGRIIQTPGGEVSLLSTGLLEREYGINDLEFIRQYIEWSDASNLKDIRSMDPDLEGFVEDTPWESDDISGDYEKLLSIAELDEVWISPGIPFIVPLFIGLLVSLTVGDLLFLVMRIVFGI